MASDIASLEIKPAGGTLPIGAAIQLNLTSVSRSGRTALIPGNSAVWSSSNDAVAEITRQGRLTPRRAGAVTITASYGGKTAQAAFVAKG